MRTVLKKNKLLLERHFHCTSFDCRSCSCPEDSPPFAHQFTRVPEQGSPQPQQHLCPPPAAAHHTLRVRDELCPDEFFTNPAGSGIPQLDGSALDTSTHECDNCHKKFTTEVQLKQHDESYKYGCEDCSICYNQLIYLIYTSLRNIQTLIMLSILFLILRSYSLLEATNDFVPYLMIVFAK